LRAHRTRGAFSYIKPKGGNIFCSQPPGWLFSFHNKGGLQMADDKKNIPEAAPPAEAPAPAVENVAVPE